MEPKTGFFQEQPGVKSMMRLQSFMVLIFFFLVNLVIIATMVKALSKGCELPAINDNFLWLDCIVLVFAFFPKVAQKLIEVKFNVPPGVTETTTASVTNEKITTGQ
jgi:hypothetical protein